MMKTKLLLVDDHAVVRSGLRMLLDGQADMEIVGEAGTASEAINAVSVLKPDQTIEETHQLFTGRQISGAPVLRDGKIIGMISKRDIATARGNGQSPLPISSCMTHEVQSIGPNRSLVRALEMMFDYDIGRLPVIEDGNLIGIVTRNDIINVVYNQRSGQRKAARKERGS